MSLELWQETELQQLQSKIVLLKALNHIPSQPAGKTPSETSHANGASMPHRILSVSREKELAETLAFVASTTDDPGKVLALAIEEDESGKGMNITLAANHGALKDVRTGLEAMADVLHGICSEGVASPNSQDRILRTIVTLNHNRILCRLRSKHARMKCIGKREKLRGPKIVPTLRMAFMDVFARAPSGLHPADFVLMSPHVEVLHTMFTRLEQLSKTEAVGKPGLEVFLAMVNAAWELSSLGVLGTVLDLSDLESPSKISIPRAICKLGRYRTAGRFLGRAAARFPIFAQIRISVIKLSAMPLQKVQDSKAAVSELMASLFPTSEVENAESQLVLRLNKKRVQHSQLCTAITSTKFVVHAEIQLLAHYELQSLALPPRIICSSKKACFLCNLFLELHGRYTVPSTHGKMYEKWTLPGSLQALSGHQAASMLDTLHAFRETLDERLKREILNPDKPSPPPSESPLLGSAVWSDVREESCAPLPRIDSGYEEGVRESVAASPSTVVKPLVRADSPYTMLTRGEAMTFELSHRTRLVKVATPRIHLTFSHAAWQESTSSLARPGTHDPERGCRLQFSWLGGSETLDPEKAIVDLASYPGDFQETFGELAGSCDFHVVNGREVVSVRTVYL